MNILHRVQNRTKQEINLRLNQHRILTLSKQISKKIATSNDQPVLFFNASTRLSGISQNAGFSLISSLALQAAGIPVCHLVCHEGLSHCVLGTDRDYPHTPPPCAECWRTSKKIFPPSQIKTFTYQPLDDIALQTASLSLHELLNYEFENMPVGEIILPSLRWILRRHHLQDDENTRYLTREYLLSACQLKVQFNSILADVKPRAVVVFNGMFYPEAVVRWVSRQVGIPVYSHEVGMLPFSAFFTQFEATVYPVDIDEDYYLTDEQNRQLDQYLEKRMSGDFITAGIRFWPEMKKLDDAYLEDVDRFKWMVPIFTNVIFDTSQGHANVVYDHMFEWLDSLLDEFRQHLDTLFIIRAHPDELREGKESRETVAKWFAEHAVGEISNVRFIPSDRYISSYDLIERSKFVMVYNSTIGLEASILGKPVLCAGKARYTQIPTVFYPQSKQAYRKMLRDFLEQDLIDHPVKFQQNARRMLFCQLFGVSLPFGDFLEDDGVWRGYVRLKKFDICQLDPDASPTIKVIQDGILKNKPFIMAS